jgi:hypothetical protein
MIQAPGDCFCFVGCFMDKQDQTCGLYYKHVTIVIDAPSVVKVMLQIVASLMIVIDDAS